MSTYRLYRSPTGDIVRVKLGFSWQACFIGSLETLARRVWLLGALAAVFFAINAFHAEAPTATSRTAALSLALLGLFGVFMLFCGVNGNRWLCHSLRRRGFTMVGEERR